MVAKSWVKGREPDFILYCDDIGLVIFEVKDWSLNQILEADKKQFRLFMNDREETRQNPMQQARVYFLACLDALKKDGRLLLADHGPHYGKPKVPISCGVIFPNIYKMEFEEKTLGTVVELETGGSNRGVMQTGGVKSLILTFFNPNK